MKRHLVITKDQSPTLFVPELDEHYHSIHGAMAESLHVFIEAGFKAVTNKSQTIRILEIGFGTGLNAWLSLQYAKESNIKVDYHGVEKYPVSLEEAQSIHYDKEDHYFLSLHESSWQEWHLVNKDFRLFKDQQDLLQFTPIPPYDLVYFDAFAPSAQPELWTIAVFEKLINCMRPGGILVTYCVKGEVRRSMKSAGFVVEKIPGPPGKREMARATKPTELY